MSDTEFPVTNVMSTTILGHISGDSRSLRVKRYDFKRPDKFSKEQIRAISIMHETFARLTTTSLSAQLRSLAELHVASVDQLTYEEFIRSIPNPTTMAIINMHPLKGAALLEIDPSITYAILDRLFGGQAGGTIMNRSLSEIEISMMDGIIERMLGNLHEAWSRLLDLQPNLGQIETNPHLTQIVPPSEMVVLVTISAKVGEATGMVNLCLPYIVIEPVVSKLSAQFMFSAARTGVIRRETPAGFCTNLPVKVDLCTDAEPLSLVELGGLRRGMMIPLEAWESGSAFLHSGGVNTPCVRQSARRGKKMAFTIPGSRITAAERSIFTGSSLARLAESTSDRTDERIHEPSTAMREELQQGLAILMKRLEEMGNRQDELADHVLLTGELDPNSTAAPDRDAKSADVDPFGFLRAADGEPLLIFLENEHPQLIALVVSSIDLSLASFVLQGLDPDLQIDVTERIYRMARVSPAVIARIRSVLEGKFAQMTVSDAMATGGYGRAVEILNLVSRSAEKHIIESLEERAPEIAEDIKQHMFVFEDIVCLDPTAILAVTENASREDLLVALKGVQVEVYNYVVSNADTDIREFIEKELPALAPVRLSEVEAAQQRIVEIIRQLENEGRILVSRTGEDDLVG